MTAISLARTAQRVMIFRQLFEPLSSTYTYLLGCEETAQAILIDPVIVTTDRDLAEIKRLKLRLAYTMDTHIHADHITAGLELKKAVGSKIAAPAFDRLPCADFGIEEGKPLQVGGITLQPLHTPGHTDGHFAYPKFMDYALPGNRLCGVCPCDLPVDLEKYCRHMSESPQG